MDYTNLFAHTAGKKSRVGIIGATRGYGYTLLAQILHVELMELRAVCSRHTKDCLDVLKEIGYEEDRIVVCENMEQIKAASENAIIIVADYRMVMECGVTGIVECTGNTAVSCEAAQTALKKGINVYMVSKETDSVCGPAFHQLAVKNNAVYSLVNGDQPRNLLDLVSWAKVLGLEIIAAGKSSEYDFVWDRENGKLIYTDGAGRETDMPELLNCWRFEGLHTLEERKALLGKYTEPVCADLCEMNLVSNVTGLVPAMPGLDYPIAKPSELADIFIPEEDGGILKKTGVTDVFYNLRGTDEASFAGGEFIIVKCENAKMWKLLEEKGHVVGRNKKYACIYWPYHLMGLESPITILLGDLLGNGTRADCRQVSVLSGVAREDLKAGAVFTVEGHHHEITCLIPELLESNKTQKFAPYYLLGGTKLIRDVAKGQTVTIDDVELEGVETYELYVQGLDL